MPDKLNDSEIVKALEYCTNCVCNTIDGEDDCPLVKMSFCKNYLMKQSLDLINRLQAENERLNKEVDRLSQCVLYHDGQVVDAVKEFAERLKKELSFGKYIQADQIDNLLKETVGEVTEGSGSENAKKMQDRDLR